MNNNKVVSLIFGAGAGLTFSAGLEINVKKLKKRLLS
jgi:hypothetical protein